MTHDVSTAAAHQVIHGHLGYLSDSQQLALDTFKDLVKTDDDDDVTLLRFLRARRWDPQAALQQYSATKEWKIKHNVDTLFLEFPAQEFEDTKRYYPRWTGRRDNMGLPVYIFQLSTIEPFEKELNSASVERRYQRIIALHEHMIKWLLPLCDALPHPILPPKGVSLMVADNPPPISSVTSIMDLSGVQLGSMWRLRNHLQQASKLATANYPETLHTIAIINAPVFFSTVWGWIKGWFDEGTRNKIHVLGTPDCNLPDNKTKGDASTTMTLLSLMPAESLPQRYGGELEFEFLDNPNLDEDAQKALGVTKYEELKDGPKIYKL